MMRRIPGQGRSEPRRTRTVARWRDLAGVLRHAVSAYNADNAASFAFRSQRPRALVRGALVDLGMAAGLGLLLLLSLVLTLALAVAQRADAGLFGTPLPGPVILLLTLVYAGAPLLVSVFVFAVLYTVGARGVLPWRAVLPGALLAAVAFEVVKVGFA